MHTLKLANRIKRALQKAYLKKMLEDYFLNKGYDSLDKPLYPAVCLDMPIRIKQLFNRVEIIPFVVESDPMTGVVRLGWNLFVMGINRIYLGSTSHTSMADLRNSIQGASSRNMPCEKVTTPQRVADFVIKILDNSKAGFVELPPNFTLPPALLSDPLTTNSQTVNGRMGRAGPSRSGQFYSK